jgi:hypothetical protein
MNVTREVIEDLWPLYAAGEASADTQSLVDDFLARDPAFAQVLQGNGTEQFAKAKVPSPPPDLEAQALSRTKRVLHRFDWLLYFAMLFSAFAFGRIISDTSWDVSPRNFIITAAIAACFWIAFFARNVWLFRTVYRTSIQSDEAR